MKSLNWYYRLPIGIAGIIMASLFVAWNSSDFQGVSINSLEFALACLLFAGLAYFASRSLFGHTISVLFALAAAGYIAGDYANTKLRDHTLIVALGMTIALLAYVGFGWIDRSSRTLLQRVVAPRSNCVPTTDRHFPSD